MHIVVCIDRSRHRDCGTDEPNHQIALGLPQPVILGRRVGTCKISIGSLDYGNRIWKRQHGHVVGPATAVVIEKSATPGAFILNILGVLPGAPALIPRVIT
jgi:hypothetical protein